LPPTVWNNEVPVTFVRVRRGPELGAGEGI
jgi:hypothetical protein